MTKKHFIALAEALRLTWHQVGDGEAKSAIERAIYNIADFCEAANPRFNRARWLGYIAGTNGKNGGKVRP